MASASNLRYKVLVGIKGMPARIWGLQAVERILVSSCTNLVPAPSTVNGDDRCEYVVAAWCVHPSLIPGDKLIGIAEPEIPHVVESPLYLRAHEIIHSDLTVLRYRARIRII